MEHSRSAGFLILHDWEDPMNRQNNGKVSPKTSKQPNPSRAKSNGGRSRAKAPTSNMKQKQQSVASAYATGQSSGKAQVFRNDYDSCRIRHREFVGNVVGTANFTVGSTFSVNPGLSASFPWLSTQAEGWEKYRFNSIKLCSYTRTGSNVPGSIILSPDYDAADSAPANEQVACSYHGTQEDAPWKDICLNLDPKMLNMERFIRTGALSANQDIKTYDIANIFVSTVDGTAVAWSKLWFEYDVTLINPQLPSGGAQGNGTLQAAGGTIAAATPFGAAPVSTGSYSVSNTGANAVITMSGLVVGQEYMICTTSTGTVISTYQYTALTGATQKTSLFTGFPAAATTGCACITILPTTSTVSVTLNVAATTITASQFVVSALVPTPAF